MCLEAHLARNTNQKDLHLLKPKAFISYSWTDQKHQDFVRQQADRLMSDGVEVVMDVFDLREGHDKYA